MASFKVCALADRGDFGSGNSAGLAFDILKQTAGHTVPSSIDLSDCPHLKPYAIACLCGLGILGQRNTASVALTMPSDDGCREHLCRLEVPRWFQCGPLPEVVTRGTNLPVELVTWPRGHAAERVIDMLAPQAQLSAGVSSRMKASLDEIICNALTHARSPIDCVIVGQAFPNTGKVEVAVLDLGQTILGHLRGNPDHAHLARDGQAILLATQDGVTGTAAGNRNYRGELNSGAGLYFVRDYCQSGGGELTILSGDTWVTFSPESSPVIGQLHGHRFRGCLVNVRFFMGFSLPEGGAAPIL